MDTIENIFEDAKNFDLDNQDIGWEDISSNDEIIAGCAPNSKPECAPGCRPDCGPWNRPK